VADFTLEAQSRTITGKQVSQLRNQGLVPAVVYGPGTDPVHIQVPYRPLEVTLMKAAGTNLIDIKVEGKMMTVLTRDVQRHILRGDILHVDFFAVDESQTLTADVFIQFVGENALVESKQAILLTGPSSLTIECLPSKLISAIEVDISGMAQIGDSVHVRDLNLGEGLTILNDPDELVVRVVQPSAARAEEELEIPASEMATVPPEIAEENEEE
jgi:large subunit ribosomal protein L25